MLHSNPEKRRPQIKNLIVLIRMLPEHELFLQIITLFLCSVEDTDTLVNSLQQL